MRWAGIVCAMAVDPNTHDRFVLRQRIRPVINQYEIWLAGEDGEPAEPVFFVEQARFKFKEDIRFYADDTKQVVLMRLKARQRFDPRARYDVADERGGKIGEIQKVFGESLLRSTYRLYDASGAEVAVAREPAVRRTAWVRERVRLQDPRGLRPHRDVRHGVVQPAPPRAQARLDRPAGRGRRHEGHRRGGRRGGAGRGRRDRPGRPPRDEGLLRPRRR